MNNNHVETLQYFLIWAIVGSCAGSFLLLLLHRHKIAETSVTKWLAIVTTVIAFVALIVRIVAVGRLPFMSGLDFSFWLCLLILGASAVMTIRQKLAVIGYLTYPITCALGLWMTSFSLEDTALAPALRSYWLDFHVSTAIISYTTFLFSFFFSVMLLMGGKKKYKNLPTTDVLNEWAYRACVIGLGAAHHRHHHRRCLGGICVGILLELGSEGNLGTHHLAHLRRLSPPAPARMVGDKGRLGQCCRPGGSHLHSVRGELPAAGAA